MDPNYGEWNASKIKMVKDLIASHSAKSTYANNINNKQIDIVDVLQARFPTKEKHKVTNLYADLMVEKMHMMLSSNQHATAGSKLVNDKFGMPVEHPTMDVLGGDLMEERKAKRKVGEDLHSQPDPQMERQRRRSWTIDEHRLMISLSHILMSFDPFISFFLVWECLSHISCKLLLHILE
jgi:hypothetical protein